MHKKKSIIPRFNLWDQLTFILCLTSMSLWIQFLTRRYLNFGYCDWDLAFFTQAMWNLIHGSQYVSLVGINYFGDHSYFLTYLLLPIFKLFPHPFTLIEFKILAFIISAIFLYYLAKEDLGAMAAFIMTFIYLIFPANVYAMIYEFNLENLTPVFLFGLFYAFQKEKYGVFLLNALLLISIKENMALIIACFGIYALCSKKAEKIRWGVVPILLGGMSFFLLSLMIIPHFRELPVHAFVVRYRHLGNSLSEIILTFLLKPFKVIWYLIAPENMTYLHELFGPFLFLSVFSLPIIFLFSPLLLQHLLSAYHPEHTIHFHYGNSMVPFIFLAGVQTFKLIGKKEKIFRFAIFFFLSACLFQTYQAGSDILDRITYNNSFLTNYRWSMIRNIPVDAPVVASFIFQAELSRRKELFSFHKVFDDYYQNAEKIKESTLYVKKNFELPKNVNYAIVDFYDFMILYSLENNLESMSGHLQEFFKQSGLDVWQAAAETILFKKNLGNGIRLVEKSREPFVLMSDHPKITIDRKFSLLFHTRGPFLEQQGRIIPLSFYWESLQMIKSNYSVTFSAKNQENGEETLLHKHLIGYAIYPTNVWESREFIKENFWLPLPELKKGKYDLYIKFSNPDNNDDGNWVEQGQPEAQRKDLKIGTVRID